jgi:hypothetical protein
VWQGRLTFAYATQRPPQRVRANGAGQAAIRARTQCGEHQWRRGIVAHEHDTRPPEACEQPGNTSHAIDIWNRRAEHHYVHVQRGGELLRVRYRTDVVGDDQKRVRAQRLTKTEAR